LEVDTILRERTHGERSLDDFCHKFHGAPGGAPAVKAYAFDDVVAALNEIAPFGWAAFLRERLDATSPRAPLAGLEASGWRLVFTEAVSPLVEAREKLDEIVALEDSLGLRLQKADGRIVDAVPGLPAYAAGIGPGMRIVAV